MMHVICMMDCWYLLLVNKAVLIILELDITIFWGNDYFYQVSNKLINMISCSLCFFPMTIKTYLEAIYPLQWKN